MSNFTIDFFEFSFLVEACIPPRPIARSVFWDEVINKHFHQMNPEERKHLYEWISRNPQFKPEENNQCLMFKLRFNPDNQYEVETNEGNIHQAFKVGEEYYLGTNKRLDINFVKKISKI